MQISKWPSTPAFDAWLLLAQSLHMAPRFFARLTLEPVPMVNAKHNSISKLPDGLLDVT